MSAFLAYFDIGIIVNAAIFVATLTFSQKIKDWFHGVPSHLRSGLSDIEKGLVAQVKTFEAELVAKIVPPPPPVAKPVEPPAV